MAYYLIKAHLKPELADELYRKLQQGEFESLRPFGNELAGALKNARLHPKTDQAIWEEEDYCSPPLAQERKAVLDRFFTDLKIEEVEKDEGWEKINDLPSLWDQFESSKSSR